jgi:hypothetical protein
MYIKIFDVIKIVNKAQDFVHFIRIKNQFDKIIQ